MGIRASGAELCPDPTPGSLISLPLAGRGPSRNPSPANVRLQNTSSPAAALPAAGVAVCLAL